jgi:hypothetical protein
MSTTKDNERTTERVRTSKHADQTQLPQDGKAGVVNEVAGDIGAAASELANHQQKLVAQEPRGPSLALMIGDTDVELPDDVDSGPSTSEPLSAEEQLDLRRYEIEIEENKEAFLTMAAALFEIWSRRLYRENYKSFKQYCRKRWDFSRAYGYKLINAHKTIQKVSTMVDTPVAITSGTQALELAKVPEDPQAEVVKNAMQKANNGNLTSRHIKEAAQELKAAITVQSPTTAPSTVVAPKPMTANIPKPAKVCPDSQIVPLVELSRIANTLHDIFLNPSRHGEAGELLLTLKEQLHPFGSV